ncbi:MAG: hypothetical protein ACYC6M_13555 [Terriglobales bacterium]
MTTEITTHVGDALAREPAQLAGKTRWGALVSALVQRTQAAENTLWDLFTLRTLNEIPVQVLPLFNVQFDRLGTIVGLSRLAGESDAVYKAKLTIKILANHSHGDASTLEQIAWLYAGATGQVVNSWWATQPPAAFLLEIVTNPILTAEAKAGLHLWLDRARAGGVAMALVNAAKPYFGFSEDPLASGFDTGKWADLF